jgi:hypothetical protein
MGHGVEKRRTEQDRKTRNWPGLGNRTCKRRTRQGRERINWPGQGIRELGMQERKPMSWPGQDTLELAETGNQNLPEGKQKAEQNIAQSRLEQTTGELGAGEPAERFP